MKSDHLPSVQTAAVLRGSRVVALEKRDVPTPNDRELLIAVRCVGICASDVNYFRQFRSRVRSDTAERPLVLGHEVSGEVVAKGAGATTPIGTRVALEPGVACGTCRECRSGHYNLCRSLTFYASQPTDGALCEYVTLPEHLLHVVDQRIDYEAAALAEPLAVALRACARALISAGSRILVTGVGPIGLLVVQAARLMGATEVLVSDVVEERLALALLTGATGVFDPATALTPNEEMDALIECTGVPTAVATGIEAVRPAGKVVLVGISGERSFPLPVATLQSREHWVTGSYRYAGDFARAVAVLNAEMVDVSVLITHRYVLSESAKALETAATSPSAIKVIVRNDSN